VAYNADGSWYFDDGVVYDLGAVDPGGLFSPVETPAGTVWAHHVWPGGGRQIAWHLGMLGAAAIGIYAVVRSRGSHRSNLTGTAGDGSMSKRRSRGLGQVARPRHHKVSHQGAKTTKGWPRISKRDRVKLLEQCGPEAFLQPEKLKFPVMTKGCVLDCRGIRVAKSRAAQHHHRNIVSRADSVGRSAKCRWAR